LESKYSVLNENCESSLPPIVVISGASNGMESMDSFARELALREKDRKIIVLGYPDAPSGKVTSKFCDAVKEVEGFDVHAKFFEEVIGKLLPEGSFELWGYSAGGGVSEVMMTKKSISERVDNLVMICPAGSKEIGDLEFKWGMMHENLALISYVKDLPKYVFVDDKTKDEQKILKFATWMELGRKCCKDLASRNLGKIKMKAGGKMVVISGESDMITRSAELFGSDNIEHLKKIQKDIEVGVVEGSLHAGPFLEPDKYIDEVLRRIRKR